MMPQIGEKAFLYIPSGDESEAYISTVMHGEGESNPYMADESVHSIGSEDDKSLVMKEDEISFQSENNEFFITMMDDEGISIVSEEDIELIAGKNGSIQSKKIKMYAKDRITLTTKKTSIIMDTAVDISGDNQRLSVADQLASKLSSNTRTSDVAYARESSVHDGYKDMLFSVAQAFQVRSGWNNDFFTQNEFIEFKEEKIKVNKDIPYNIDRTCCLKLEFKTHPKCIKHHIYTTGSADTIACLCDSSGKAIKKNDNNGTNKNINITTTDLKRDKSYYLNITVKDKSKKNVKVTVKESVEKVKKLEKLNSNGINLIANMERNKAKIVWDEKSGEILSVPTMGNDVGYGHDVTKKPMNPIPKSLSAKEAYELLSNDVKEFEKAIATGIRVSFTQDQFNALVSLRYNIGSLGVVEGLLRYLEEGSYEKSKLRGIVNTYYDVLVKNNPDLKRYLPGWYSRTENFLKVFFDSAYGVIEIDAVNGKVIVR